MKKLRDGYWVLIPDQTLEPGESAFAIPGYSGGNGVSMAMDAFGID